MTRPAPPAARIDVVLVGTRGQVGTALRQRLAVQQPQIARQAGVDLRLLATFDRRGFAFDLAGLAPANAEASMRPRRDADIDALFAHLAKPDAAPAIVVDCTASDDIASRYPEWLGGGLGVVTANKRANARSLAFYWTLQRLADEGGVPYRYETTVGAAIPLLGPLRDLRLRGERVRRIEGVMSGSLGFLLQQLHAGVRFSDALAEARRLGYTESDPGDDLRADDLARKLVVLAREAGFALESADIDVQPFSAHAKAEPLHWAKRLDREDREWQERISWAQGEGLRWVMLAEVDAGGARIGLRALPPGSPFAALAAGQNLVRVETELQAERPLLLGGPGAGPDVTAAGVLSDLIGAAEKLSRCGASARARIAA